ncbi:RadC family protein [Oceanobacillus sojae]|uniref:RadC family protein n=1 Tax=Oceanobacillus sojae TaxID=582851 RepID=UPI00098835B0|nr:DNA repair protein RadC [Oceanobacillus sojae]MCT1903373.1 DNA repair protein RadC [Oceanobacillus sojae]
MGKPIFIRDLPTEDRPRERLLKHGANKLSNQEILSILIGSGSKNDPVQMLADRILMHFEGIKLLRDATVEELTAIKGIGVAKSLNILAAIELGKRISSYKSLDTYMIRSPEDGANYVMEEMRNLAQEHFVALFLNTKNQIIHRQTLFIGSLNASIVHPRELFREAVRRSAASVLVCHNHPSGDPTPSQEDILVTKRLVESGKIIGIEVIDHLVIGNERFVSLKQKGYL